MANVFVVISVQDGSVTIRGVFSDLTGALQYARACPGQPLLIQESPFNPAPAIVIVNR